MGNVTTSFKDLEEHKKTASEETLANIAIIQAATMVALLYNILDVIPPMHMEMAGLDAESVEFATYLYKEK